MRAFILLFLFTISLSPAFADENELQKLVRLKNEFIGSEIFCHSPETDTELELFKHCYLRFVHPHYSNDIAINFQVHTEIGVMAADAVPLIFGGYQMTMYVQKFSEIWSQYFFSGQVKSYRSILTLNSAQIQSVIDEIELWSKDITKIGKYTLFKNNCVGALIKLFKNTNIISDKISHEYHPGEFPKWLVHSGLTKMPIATLRPVQIRQELANVLGLTGTSIHDSNEWPQNSFEMLEKDFFKNERAEKRKQLFQTLLYSGFNMPLNLRRELSKKYKTRRRNDYKKLTQLNSIEQSLYGEISYSDFIPYAKQWTIGERHQYLQFLLSKKNNLDQAKDLTPYQIHELKLDRSNFGKMKRIKVRKKRSYLEVQVCREFKDCRDERIKLSYATEDGLTQIENFNCQKLEITKNKVSKNCSLEIIKDSGSQKLLLIQTRGDLNEIN